MRRQGWALGVLWAAGLVAACKTCGTESAKEPSAQARPVAAPSQAPSVSWEGPIPVAKGGGHAGPWRMNESEFHYVDDPTVAVAEDGRIAVAWVDNRRKAVLFQVYGPDGEPRLDEPVDVSGTPEIFSWLPRMLMSADGMRLFILWQEIVFSGGTHGGEAFFARSEDGGRTFHEPLNLSRTTAGCGKGRLTRERWHNGSLDLALGPDGHLLAAWTEYEGPLRLSRSTDGGRTFSEPIHVAGSTAEPARGPSLAVGPGGTVHLAWTVGEDPAADVRLARSEDGGRSFGRAVRVHETGGHSDAPKIAAGPDGSLHLAYAESPAGPFRDYHVRYARRPAGAPSFESPSVISGSPSDRQAASFPSLDLDGEGNPHVLWEHYPHFGKRPRGLGFALSTDGGDTFAAPSLIPATADPALGANGSRQGLLMRKLAVDDGGTLAVVNSRFVPNEQSQVRLYLGERR